MPNTTIFESAGGKSVAINGERVLYITPTEACGREAIQVVFSEDHEIVVFGEFQEACRRLMGM